MERRFKVGDYVKLINTDDMPLTGKFTIGNVYKVNNIGIFGSVQIYSDDGVELGLIPDRFELAEDYILKELWK